MKTKFTNERLIRVGTRIVYRGGFGRNPQKTASVTAIERTYQPGEKYGQEVDEVSMHDHYVLNLDDGHWCYSHQVDGVLTDLQSVS